MTISAFWWGVCARSPGPEAFDNPQVEPPLHGENKAVHHTAVETAWRWAIE